MSVSFTWFANANTNIINSVVQAPSLDTCLIVGIFPEGDVSDFSGKRIVRYTDYASYKKAFTFAVAPTGDQANWYDQLDKAVRDFFNQKNVNPEAVLIGRISPSEEAIALNGADPNVFVPIFIDMKQNYQSWYAFTVADYKPCQDNLAGTYDPKYVAFTTCMANAMAAMNGMGAKAFYWESTSDLDVFADPSAKTDFKETFAPFVLQKLVKKVEVVDKDITLVGSDLLNSYVSGTYLKIESEILKISGPPTAVNNTIKIPVDRAQLATTAAAHATTASVVSLVLLSTAVTSTDMTITVTACKDYWPNFVNTDTPKVLQLFDGTNKEYVTYSSATTPSTAGEITFTLVQRGYAGTTASSFSNTTFTQVLYAKEARPGYYVNPASIVRDTYARPDWAMFFHTKNCSLSSDGINYAAAAMGYFFIAPKGKTLSRAQLAIPADNLSRAQLDAATASFVNTYAGFSATGGNAEVPQGLAQYGHCVTSTSTNKYYIDQVYTANYAELNAEADLATLMLQNSIYYDDMGIQRLVTSVKKTLEQLVADDMLMPFGNDAITFTPYAKVPAANIADRVYGTQSSPGIVANMVFKSHIQKVQFNINIRIQ